MLQKHSEEDPKESGNEDAALFDPAADVEGLRGAAIKLHSPLHVAVEGLDQALQRGWATNLWQDFEETLSADEVEGLSQIDEGDVQGHLLFTALLLELAEREDHVYCQEPITRSVQLNYFRATAFSQVRLFLDTPFPPKITVSGYLRIEI